MGGVKLGAVTRNRPTGAHGTTECDDDSPLDAEVEESERIPDEAPKRAYLWVVLSGWLLGAEAWLRSHGGRGLRYGISGFWARVAFTGVVLLAGPVINQPLTLDDITGSASSAADRWIAREFAVDYRITRTAEGLLVAQVEERISAFFPEGTHDRGIERVLSTQYQEGVRWSV